ncbi:MAG: GntR family transcriptional regulator [Piscirickettsiaceae bacterium]|nr:GntR family transcriptional regulator [Piscirickettsiaceae bacterium]
MVGEYAYLNVAEVNIIGSFLDWGMPEHLLVPFGEQQRAMIKGGSYVVYLYIDSRSERVLATTKLDKYLSTPPLYFRQAQQVDSLIYGRTDLAYKAVVNGITVGLLFYSDVFTSMKYGQKLKGYIKKIREDNKLDLCLQLSDSKALDKLSQRALNFIWSEGGAIILTDNSKPNNVYAQFGVSKSSYKKALGRLYKKRLILITMNKVSLVR